jgi:uncharacterized protein YecA (UPF0149 family)
MAHLPDLGRLTHARKDTLILALWAQAQELLAANADLTRRIIEKVSRNDPCPCGSGKKFKKCCAA